MNKPASELIALADNQATREEVLALAINNELCRQIDAGEKMDSLRVTSKIVALPIVQGLLAANQSGSERAGVDRAKLAEWADDFEAAAHEVPRGIKSTILMTRAQEVRVALATPPAQPAPVSGESSTSSDGGSMEQPFALADAVRETPAPRASSGKQEGRTGSEVGAKKIAGSSMSCGPDKPIIAGQAPSPSESTHGKPDGAVREALSALVNAVSNMRVPQNVADAALQITIIGPVLERAKAALHSPKIAAAETSPGDVLDVLRSIRAMCDEPLSYGRSNLADRIAAAIDRLDVKAEAKSQEPDAVAVQERKWKQPVKTVADLVNNLMTIDQTMDVHAAYFITYGDGRKEARTRSPSLSRERVANSRINDGDEAVPYSLVIWTSQDERPTTKPEASVMSLNGVTQVVYDHGPSFSWDECKKIAGSLLARFHITDRGARS